MGYRTLFFWIQPDGLPQSGNIFYLNIIVFMGLLGTLWILRRNRLLIFAFAFYVANIFFLLRLHNVLGLVSDRFMYLASIGLCMFAAVLVEKAFSWAQNRRPILYGVTLALLLIVVILTSRTWSQCEVWQNSVNLWNNQLQYNSRTLPCFAYCKLADAYAETYKQAVSKGQRFDQIRSLYQKAIDLKPDFAGPYYGLGNLYADKRDDVSAERFYKEAIARDSKNFVSFFSLGQIYQHRGSPNKAISFYHEAISARPENINLCLDILEQYNDAIKAHDNAEIYQKEKSKMSDCERPVIVRP
ncbi:MAG: hypothetical protein HQL12_08335 [Candidatus Omnitrophica bacterium]|nr:hypothetical protein [Candidatus Omnitrophota bacterium]